jgi:hypothetical protein
MLSDSVIEKLVDGFWNGIEGYSWDDWCSMSSKDKEEIVPDVILELGMEVDIDEVYDLFWEWAEGLDKESFGEYEDEEEYEDEDYFDTDFNEEEEYDD